jgi:hypothetical protein
MSEITWHIKMKESICVDISKVSATCNFDWHGDNLTLPETERKAASS